jgi:uncharacterized protein DUF3147
VRADSRTGQDDTPTQQEPVDVRPRVGLSKLRDVQPHDYGVRFAFGAVISATAALIAKGVSPRFGGMFLAFPAILPASLTLLQEKEGTRRADRNAIGAVLGGVGLVVFAGIAEASFGRLPAWLALLLALAGWLAVSAFLYGVLAVLRPDDCDRNQD